jgi:hypothetical protein
MVRGCKVMSITSSTGFVCGLSEEDAKLIADAPLLAAEVERLRGALITVQRSLIWDEIEREMDGDPITLEALVEQVEQVRSDITEAGVA